MNDKRRKVKRPNRNARLYAAMAMRDCNVNELAEAAKVNRVTICNVRAGAVVPSLPTALQIARHLEFSVEDLFGQLAETGE